MRSVIVLPLIALFACAGLARAEEGHGRENPQVKAAEIETATVTGTVTAVNAEKKSFTLKDDAGGESADYRAYFRDGKQGHRLESIAALKVGDHITVVYTEAEGRRVISLEAAKK